MKVAVVIFPFKPKSALITLGKAVVKGIESQGHQVDFINGMKEPEKKLAIYKYIAIGCEPVSMFGKISERIAAFLSSAGPITGKKSFAFIYQTTFGSQKALLSLMELMEKEGMLIKTSNIFKKEIIAQEIGKRLHIE